MLTSPRPCDSTGTKDAGEAVHEVGDILVTSKLNMLSNTLRRTGLIGVRDNLELAPSERLEPVCLAFGDVFPPLTYGTLRDAQGSGQFGLRPVVRDRIGFAHATQGTAC